MYYYKMEEHRLAKEVRDPKHPVFQDMTITSRDDKIAFVDERNDGILTYLLDLWKSGRMMLIPSRRTSGVTSRPIRSGLGSARTMIARSLIVRSATTGSDISWELVDGSTI